MINQTKTSPDLLNSEQLKLIADALRTSGAMSPCHRCGSQGWSLENGLVVLRLHAAQSELNLGGPGIPTAVVICVQCGVVNHHALGSLGLLQHPAFGL